MKYYSVIHLKLLRIELNELREVSSHSNNHTVLFFATSIQFPRLFETFELDEISDKLTSKLRFDIVLIVNSTTWFPVNLVTEYKLRLREVAASINSGLCNENRKLIITKNFFN